MTNQEAGAALPIVERLRQDRLLNPDYATRYEAADTIEELVEALKEARRFVNFGTIDADPDTQDEARMVLAKTDALLAKLETGDTDA